MVNLQDPDDHFFFKIFPCKDITGRHPKTRYDGFLIIMETDNRWFYDDSTVDWYQLRIFSSNQLLATVPGQDYDFVFNRQHVLHQYDLEGDEDILEQMEDEEMDATT